MSNNNTASRKVQPRKKLDIPPHAMVKFKPQGARHAEVTYLSKGIPRPTVRRLDKERYLVVKSGEIKEFGHYDQKQKSNLRKTFAELRGIIRANFDGEDESQLFITLTYAENMTDPEKLYEDFAIFWKRLKYSRPKHKLEYVAVAEPQERGAWHMHLMLKSDQPVLYIDNKELTAYQPHPKDRKRLFKDPVTKKPVITGGLWGHGSTTVERLKSDDVGRYYVSYFTSLEMDATKIVKRKDGSKKYRKGARLPLYPKNFKLYRCSKGIVRPEAENTPYQPVVEEFGVPYHVSTYDILDGEEVVNTVQLESFKKKYPKDLGGAP